MSDYKIEAVGTVKDSFSCPHCNRLLRDAVQNEEGYRLCKECCDVIRKLPGGRCDDCGMTIPPDSEIYPDKAARREIDSLIVYCPNRSLECDWTGPLSTLEVHVSQCQYRGVTCPNKGCGHVTSSSKLKLHLEECPFRDVECNYCHSILPHGDLSAHLEGECECYPKPCEQCGELVTRKEKKQHLQKTCPFIKCKHCNILVDRETSREVVDGKLGKPHFSDQKTAFDHSQDLATELAETRSDLKQKHQSLENTVNLALVKVNESGAKRENEDIKIFKTLLQELQRKVSRQDRTIESQAKELALLRDKIGEVSVTNTATPKGPSLNGVTRREPIRTTGFTTHEELTSEPSYSDSQMLQMAKSIEELQRATSVMKVHISELELQLQASLASTHNGQFLWRIPEVARRKRDAFEGRITSIYSPPFYSSRNGYKMCIRAYLNGDGIGFNTHLSVFFVLMRGEYDPLLKWPFDCKVSLILVDQDMRQHIVQTFKPSPESSSFQRPRSDMNIASGCPQFAKLSVLGEGNYVKNDVMFLKCIIDVSKISHP